MTNPLVDPVIDTPMSSEDHVARHRLLSDLAGAGQLIALGLFLVVTSAHAETVPDLYVGHAVITGTEDPERTRGLRIALADVIVKVTGDVRLADDSRMSAILEQPERLVADLTLTDRMKGIPLHDEQGTRERPHNLVARFDAVRLDAALSENGLRLWPADRPIVAVRLLVETDSVRFVLAEAGPEGYGQRLALTETAARRGLPIRLPTAAAAAELAANPAAVSAVPSGGGALLSGTLRIVEGGSWDIDWTLSWSGRSAHWSDSHVSFDDAIRTGVEGTAMRLSSLGG